MRRVLALTLGVIAAVWPAERTRGQTLMVQPTGATSQVTLVPLDGEGTIFAAPPAGSYPGVPRILSGNLNIDVGFQYLRPDFPDRAVTLVIPPAVAGSFPFRGRVKDISHDFSFIPQLAIDYQFPNLGFGLGASGKQMTLEGRLQRTVNSEGVNGNLVATSSVDIAIANLVELTKYAPLDQYRCFQDTCLEDSVLFASIGARYSFVEQDFTATLSSNVNNVANQTTIIAHQDFLGFGLTGSIMALHPVCPSLYLYGKSRGSILLGTNNRSSSFNVNVPGNPASSTGLVTETETDLIPVGEFEIGFAWGTPLRPPQSLPQPVPILWIKTGLVTQVWGNLGLLSPTDGARNFSDGNFFLYGFSVFAGIDY